MPFDPLTFGIGAGISLLGGLFGQKKKAPSWIDFNTDTNINFDPTKLDFSRAFSASDRVLGREQGMMDFIGQRQQIAERTRAMNMSSLVPGMGAMRAAGISSGAGFRTSQSIAALERRRGLTESLDTAARTFDSSSYDAARFNLPFQLESQAAQYLGMGLQTQVQASQMGLQRATRERELAFERDRINAIGRNEAAVREWGRQSDNAGTWGGIFGGIGGMAMGMSYKPSTQIGTTDPSRPSDDWLRGLSGGQLPPMTWPNMQRRPSWSTPSWGSNNPSTGPNWNFVEDWLRRATAPGSY